jgi:hypothetical protein
VEEIFIMEIEEDEEIFIMEIEVEEEEGIFIIEIAVNKKDIDFTTNDDINLDDPVVKNLIIFKN